MSRFGDLIETVDAYQKRAGENYDRIRGLAEDLRSGFCDYLDASDGVCVHLVPPVGAFQPRPAGDQAFSAPPRGFRPLGPVAFGLAVRVSRGTDWIRVTMACRKTGDDFIVQIDQGPNYEFTLPLADHDPSEFYEILYQHIKERFTQAIERYDEGEYSTRSIGFDFSEDEPTTQSV